MTDPLELTTEELRQRLATLELERFHLMKANGRLQEQLEALRFENGRLDRMLKALVARRQMFAKYFHFPRYSGHRN